MIENQLKFRKMTSMESGRTMVEILAVLAIMGVLTLGAVMGYRYAVDKLNANDIIDGVNKRAAVAAPQRILGQPINLTEFHPDSDIDLIKGVYEVVAVDIHGRNPDFFSLTAYDIQKGVCDRIMDSGYAVPSVIEVNSVAQLNGSTCEESEDGLYDITFVFDNTLGEKEYQECEIDAECGTGNICNQITSTCMPIPEGQIIDIDGNSHDCNSNRLILPLTASECDKCPNRKMFSGYCIPTCRDDEWLERQEGGSQPRVVCRKCDARTGWHYGTQNRAFCEVCPERYYFEDTWGSEHMCVLRDCGEGYVSCNDGCCGCGGGGAISIALAPTGRTSCEACNDPTFGPREVVGNLCRVKNCPAGYFRYNNDCIACSSTNSYNVSNAANRANCLACTDDNGNKMRRLNGQSCVLASKCLHGTQEDDPSTPDVDESIYCAECPTDTFPVGNECKSCDDNYWYEVSPEICARCGDKRFVRESFQTFEWWWKSNVCMRVKKDGEFYSSAGTQACTYTGNTLDNGDCGSCGDLRVITQDANTNERYCTLACQEGEFMAIWGTCYSCDAAASPNLSSINHVQQYCSSVCPGQRYLRSGKCAKCPAGTYSIGSNATSCDGVCPADRTGLAKGPCIACGGTWDGTACDGQGCASGEYNKNGICTTCPEDLSDFTGAINETYCRACGGLWNNLSYKCCPSSDFSSLKNQNDCEGCYGQWANNTCTKCPTGYWGGDGVCNQCLAYADISDQLNCQVCGGSWNAETETCSS